MHNHACRIYKKSKSVVMFTVSRYPAKAYGENYAEKVGTGSETAGLG